MERITIRKVIPVILVFKIYIPKFIWEGYNRVSITQGFEGLVSKLLTFIRRLLSSYISSSKALMFPSKLVAWSISPPELSIKTFKVHSWRWRFVCTRLFWILQEIYNMIHFYFWNWILLLGRYLDPFLSCQMKIEYFRYFQVIMHEHIHGDIGCLHVWNP